VTGEAVGSPTPLRPLSQPHSAVLIDMTIQIVLGSLCWLGVVVPPWTWTARRRRDHPGRLRGHRGRDHDLRDADQGKTPGKMVFRAARYQHDGSRSGSAGV